MLLERLNGQGWHSNRTAAGGGLWRLEYRLPFGPFQRLIDCESPGLEVNVGPP
jgi:hypothetical protein